METVKIKVYIYIFYFIFCFFSHFPFVQTQPKVVNPSKQGSKDQNPESFYFTLKESEREREQWRRHHYRRRSWRWRLSGAATSTQSESAETTRWASWSAESANSPMFSPSARSFSTPNLARNWPMTQFFSLTSPSSRLSRWRWLGIFSFLFSLLFCSVSRQSDGRRMVF